MLETPPARVLSTTHPTTHLNHHHKAINLGDIHPRLSFFLRTRARRRRRRRGPASSVRVREETKEAPQNDTPAVRRSPRRRVKKTKDERQRHTQQQPSSETMTKILIEVREISWHKF